jgi:hypothetical protein
MSERSELSESDRTSKKKSEFASEVGVERSVTSRSKNERIINKMGAAQSGGGEDKKTSKLKECVRRMGGYCCFAKVYSCSSRARGLT